MSNYPDNMNWAAFDRTYGRDDDDERAQWAEEAIAEVQKSMMDALQDGFKKWGALRTETRYRATVLTALADAMEKLENYDVPMSIEDQETFLNALPECWHEGSPSKTIADTVGVFKDCLDSCWTAQQKMEAAS